MTKLKARIPALAAIFLAFGVLTSPAFAQSPQLDGYSDEGGQIQDYVTSNPGDEPTDQGDVAPTTISSDDGDGGSSLPFTGLDLGLIALAGACLMLLGLALRRLTSSPHTP